jgi:hypothetical protein
MPKKINKIKNMPYLKTTRGQIAVIGENGIVASVTAENLIPQLINGGDLNEDLGSGYADVRITQTKISIYGKEYIITENLLNIYEKIASAISGDPFYTSSFNASGKGFLITVYAKVENTGRNESLKLDYAISKIANLSGTSNIFETFFGGQYYGADRLQKVDKSNSIFLGFIVAEYTGGDTFVMSRNNFRYRVLSIKDILQDFINDKSDAKVDLSAGFTNISKLFNIASSASIDLTKSECASKYSSADKFILPGVQIVYLDGRNLSYAKVDKASYATGASITNLLFRGGDSYMGSDLRILKSGGGSSSITKIKTEGKVFAYIDFSLTSGTGELNNIAKPYPNLEAFISDLQTYLNSLSRTINKLKISLHFLHLENRNITSHIINIHHIFKVCNNKVRNVYLYLDFNNLYDAQIKLGDVVNLYPNVISNIFIRNLHNSQIYLVINDKIESGYEILNYSQNITFKDCKNLSFDFQNVMTDMGGTNNNRYYDFILIFDKCDAFHLFTNSNHNVSLNTLISYSLNLNIKDSKDGYIRINETNIISNIEENINDYTIIFNFENLKTSTIDIEANAFNQINRNLDIYFNNCEDCDYGVYCNIDGNDPNYIQFYYSLYYSLIINNYSIKNIYSTPRGNFTGNIQPKEVTINNSNCVVSFVNNFNYFKNIKINNSVIKFLNPSHTYTNIIDNFIVNNSKITISKYPINSDINLYINYFESTNSTFELSRINSFNLLQFDYSNSYASTTGLKITNSYFDYNFIGNRDLFTILTDATNIPNNTLLGTVNKNVEILNSFINSTFKLSSNAASDVNVFFYDLTNFTSSDQRFYNIFENATFDFTTLQSGINYNFINFSNIYDLTHSNFDIFASNLITNANTKILFDTSERISLRGETNYIVNKVTNDKNLSIDGKYYVVMHLNNDIKLYLPTNFYRMGKEFVIYNSDSAHSVRIMDGSNLVTTLLPGGSAKVIYLGPALGWKVIQ